MNARPSCELPMQDRSRLQTEQRLEASMRLDTMGIEDAIAVMNHEDRVAADAVALVAPSVCQAVRLVPALSSPADGYCGLARHQWPAGRSRRLGMSTDFPVRTGNGARHHCRRQCGHVQGSGGR